MLTAPPPGFGHCFRDPYVWRADDTWQMLLGSTQRDDDVAAVLHYVSPDLAEWDFVGPLHVACDGDMGREAECPELFELDGRHVLVASDEHTRAVVGALDESGRFVPDAPAHTFDPGACYAARSVDIAGRRIQIAWVCDTRDRDASEAAGWRGALSVPRELTLDPDGRFRVAPVAELERLRSGLLLDDDVPLRRTPTVFADIHTLAVELLVATWSDAPSSTGHITAWQLSAQIR